MKLLTIILLLCGYTSLAQVPSDTVSYSQSQFDELPAATQSMLWYRDIENANPTQFTSYWSGPRYHSVRRSLDSADNNPQSLNSNHPFIDHYFIRDDIELAFQLGPYSFDLGADCYYIVKRLDTCFQITRSYFRHARFTFKSYALVDKQQLDSLYLLLGNFKQQSLAGGSESIGLAGHFADNRNKKKYFIDLEKEAEPKTIANNYEWKSNKTSQEFYDFLDKHIHWTVTYQL